MVRKLASSLVAILRHPITPLKKAIWQLAASLVHGGYVSEEVARGVDFAERILPELNKNATGALLFFSIALAEEALRADSESQGGQTSVLQRAIWNMQDGLSLVQFVLNGIMQYAHTSGDDAVDVALATEAMSSWKVRHGEGPSNLGIVLLTNHVIDVARVSRNPSALCDRQSQRTGHQLWQDCHRDTPTP